MSSFSKLSVWPVGYFRAYSSWLLKNRRDIARRISVINAEIERIGTVKVDYQSVESNGETRKTEQRTGITVTPGSSLGRLFRAYVAMGGDPLSISPFAYPESTALTEGGTTQEVKVQEEYPHGGVAAPRSAAPNEPVSTDQDPGWGAFPGGYLETDAYYPARQGGRLDPGSYDHDGVTKSMQQIRGWASQEIKERQNLEWQIMKLCDLREQLVQERDDTLVQAFGGAVTGVGPLDTTRFDESLLVQNIVQDMYALLYETDDTGRTTSFSPNSQVPFLQFTFPNVPSEVGRDMSGC
jgi:hypothetical protein